MSNPKISVILPVYNVEEYVCETLDSLLNQSMIEDIEVIMVDDGSTDSSRYIIERYALDHDGFHAYHKKKEGPGIARNFGLEIARGDYIYFLDSDDYLPPHACETLYNLAVKDGCDIAVGKAMRFARYNIWEDIVFKNAFKDIDEDIRSTAFVKHSQLVWDTVIWNKLYRRDFIEKNNLRFLNRTILFEDLLFSIEAYLASDSITITKDIIYYWRLRSNSTSITQQDLDVTNLKDRLKILNLIKERLTSHDLPYEIITQECLKLLNHDLKYFIKRFNHFPSEDHRKLFDDIYELVKDIPTDLIDGMNSYKKVLYRMILNRDFDSFLLFAPLENDLFENPEIPDFLDEEYKSYFDFKKAVKDEELIVELTDAECDGNDLLIAFEGKINYLTDEEYEITAKLVDINGEHPLEVTAQEKPVIRIPISLIEGMNHSMLSVTYAFDGFKKESHLKNRHRKSYETEDAFIDLNIGFNSYLYIDYRNRTGNKIEISQIIIEEDEFLISGESHDRINQVYIENVMDFERISYPAEYGGEAREFSFRIPFRDILNAPVKKWEMNCEDSLNSIWVVEPFEFYDTINKTRFINSRNKVLIEHDAYSVVDELKDFKVKNRALKSQISDLNMEKEKLIEENSQLNERISEFKSRKVVKIADKIKFK